VWPHDPHAADPLWHPNPLHLPMRPAITSLWTPQNSAHVPRTGILPALSVPHLETLRVRQGQPPEHPMFAGKGLMWDSLRQASCLWESYVRTAMSFRRVWCLCERMWKGSKELVRQPSTYRGYYQSWIVTVYPTITPVPIPATPHPRVRKRPPARQS